MKGLKNVQSVHKLDHTVTGTCRLGRLYPIFCRYFPPRSKINLQHAVDIRLEPTRRPVQTPIAATIHDWAIPIRLIWDDKTSIVDKFTNFIVHVDNPSGLIPPYIGISGLAGNMSTTLLDYFGYPITAPGGSAGNYAKLRA